MPECPYCHTRTNEDHLFCRSCGASLKLPEYNRAFCPHCGARVSIRQTFCHECNWPLEAMEEQAKMPPGELESGDSLKQRQPWFNALLWTGGILSVLILLVFIIRGSSLTPEPPAPLAKKVEKLAISPAAKLSPPAPEQAKPPGPAPSTNSPELKTQLQELLNRLRQAQLNKDVDKYLGAYASTFPQREEKRARTLKIWEAFDFTGLEYELQEIKSPAAGQATAQITWHLRVRDLRDNSSRSQIQTFRVWFSREAGQWRISRLEPVPQGSSGAEGRYAQAS